MVREGSKLQQLGKELNYSETSAAGGEKGKSSGVAYARKQGTPKNMLEAPWEADCLKQWLGIQEKPWTCTCNSRGKEHRDLWFQGRSRTTVNPT